MAVQAEHEVNVSQASHWLEYQFQFDCEEVHADKEFAPVIDPEIHFLSEGHHPQGEYFVQKEQLRYRVQ